jgi:hypothetical protein
MTPLFSAPAPAFAKCWLSSSSNAVGSCFEEVLRRDTTLDLSLLTHSDSVNIFRIDGKQSTPKPKVISAILHIFMSAPAQSVSSDFANCTVLFTRIAAQMVALPACVSLGFRRHRKQGLTEHLWQTTRRHLSFYLLKAGGAR